MININKNYKIGLRAIKTAIAVFFCTLISVILNREDLFCSAAVSVVCMRQSYKKSLEKGIDRFVGTVIGAAIGYLALELSGYIPYYDKVRIFVLPMCILLVSYFCNLFNRRKSVSIGCVILLVIIARINYDMTNNFMFVIQRVIDTLIGIAISTIINKYFFINKNSK
ncbi:MAG: FUSC family protein [Candidatus Paraimprobicoccus trichonymphae]|uniref:FUSC family protein n=1 Tax=Candidatus Paraimprobicoccus trichonymphae TaxID=3033793 RepID=A0AA48HWP5_9FIRM|nr:MAG: FUSC family protein [Candidatus Paraimprobicoccus trichonymphae]